MTSESSEPTPSEPTRPIAPGWLALREPADARARDEAAGTLLPPLLQVLKQAQALKNQAQSISQTEGQTEGQTAGLRVVDLGSGTGANLRWLAPRLPSPDRQHWTLVDHDPGLLARGPVHATALRADVADLAAVLAGLSESPGLGGTDLVTAAALLDLLDPRQLTAIVEAIVEAQVPALFSLTVSGEVLLDPPDPQDEPLATAFDAHQRRDGRLGPDAATAVTGLFRERGWSVIGIRTPWLLNTADHPELIDAWLEGRAEAAAEHEPDLVREAAGWLARRRAHPVEAVVGHIDVLALPG